MTRRRARSFQPEALEGRAMLAIASGPVFLKFTVPGPPAGGWGVMGGPPVFTGVPHAFPGRDADSVTLSLGSAPPSQPRDEIRVDVETVPLTDPASADPGVPYPSTHQTVVFPPGVRTIAVTIPIDPGARSSGSAGFRVVAQQLNVPPDQFGIGRATEDVFLARSVDASAVPRIDGAWTVVKGRRTSEIRLHFSRPMDRSSVENVKAYYIQDLTFHSHPMPLFGPWGPNTTSATTRLRKAVYDPATNIVSLRLAKSVDARDGLQVSQSVYLAGGLRSSEIASPVLRDATGVPIHEDGSGYGGAFMVTINGKTAKIVDGVTQAVVPSKPTPGS